MHAIKGAWAGQTFALAKSHESGGRKARIRRSKEERKAMVESFIKKYQSLNNGNFPTLNLAHKEVGGSFYTVREIVREIIQENRVLGPGKWTEDEQKAEQFLNEHPLGSISIEPEYSLSSSASENNVISHRDLGGSDKSLLAVDGLIVDDDNDKYGNERIIDGSTMNLKNGSDEEIYTEFEVNGNAMVLEDESGEDFRAELEVNGIAVELKDESDKEINTESEVSRIASELKDDKGVSPVLEVSVEPGANGVAVELQDKSNQEVSSEMEVNGSAMDLEHETGKEVGVKLVEEAREDPILTTSHVTPTVTVEAESDIKPFVSTSRVTQITTDVIVETFPLRPVSSSTAIDGSSVETKNLTETSDMLFEEKSPLVNSNPPPEASEQSTPIVSETQGGQSDSTPKIDEKIVSSSNGLPKINVAIPGNATGESNRTSVQHNASSRRSTATLNRINLESWEGTAKGKAASETNPLLSIFKSFITAFVKFWSE